jgi:mRNA-degrading endonuclease YafQ of YafQ-DinJ toxin-antitoxin module
VKIYYSPKFIKEYRRLPGSLKLLVEKKEKLFRENPRDARLKLHKLDGKLSEFWSFSVNYQNRVIVEFVGDEVWFHSIGTHDIYK